MLRHCALLPLFVMPALVGCIAVPPPTPPAPPAQLTLNAEVAWPAVYTDGVPRYQPAEGEESTRTISDVTLRFRVVNEQDGAELTIPCALTQGRIVMLPVYALGLWIDVENRTDHILRFAGSELVVEDGEARQIPLFRGSWDAWKASVAARVEGLYAGQMEVWSRWRADAQAQFDQYGRLEVLPYAERYAAYLRDADSYLANEQKPQLIIAYDFDRARADKAVTLAPEAYLAQAQQRLTEQLSGPKQQLEQGRRLALEAVQRLQRPNLLTSDEWGGMRILPGRSLAGIVPLNAGLDGQEPPRDMHVQVIDLVTKTDEAANATARSTFQFHLTRATQ